MPGGRADTQAAYWQSLNMQQKVKRNAQQPLPRAGSGYAARNIGVDEALPTAGSAIGHRVLASGPLRYAIVDGMNVRASRVHNYPPRWNAAPSQDLLVIR
jgi:hypothetical protein